MVGSDRTVRSLSKKPGSPSTPYLFMQYLSTKGYPVTPQEIASFHELNPGSVRARLSEMYSKGLISKPYHGHYQCDPTYPLGMHGGGLRTQNLLVVSEGVAVRESDEVHIDFPGYVSIHVTFGLKRGRISYMVGVPLGLCPVGMVLVHGHVLKEVEARGYSVANDSWMVKRAEVLEDFRGFKLEGMESITFEGYLGEIVKFYNKPGLRREAKTGVGIQLNQFRALIEEGVDSSLLHRRMDQIERELRRVVEVTKGSSRVAVETKRLSQALLNAFIRRGE